MFKNIIEAVISIHKQASRPPPTPARPAPLLLSAATPQPTVVGASIWELQPVSTDVTIPEKHMLYSDAICLAVQDEPHEQLHPESSNEVPDLLCHMMFPPLVLSTTAPRPASTSAPRPLSTPAPRSASPAPRPASRPTCAARFNVEPWNIYNPVSGVTNNAAESFNAVIKRLLEWKEVPVDCLCMS